MRQAKPADTVDSGLQLLTMVDGCLSNPSPSSATTVNNRQQPSTTVNNRQQPSTTVNNRQQPSTTVNNRQPS
jgi:hypothetical protein